MGRIQLFLEISSLIRGFVENNAYCKSASHSSLFPEFVLSAAALPWSLVSKFDSVATAPATE